MNFVKSIILLGLVLVFISGCKTGKHLPKKVNNLESIIDDSQSFNNGFTGFALYDPKQKKMISERNTDKYFTPASVMKILTCYTGLKTLKETPNGLRYQSTKDGTTFRGNGNPGFLNSRFVEDEFDAFLFLKNHKKPLTFCDCNYMDQHFGSGWSWDDYHYHFQAEKSAFPIYGNMVNFRKPSKQSPLIIKPDFFKKNVLEISKNGRTTIYRKIDENIFEFSGSKGTLGHTDRPFKTSTQTTIELLQDTLKKEIKLCNGKCETGDFKKVSAGVSTQQLLRQLMVISDNLVAEQLLLMCAEELCDTLQINKAIDWSMKNLLNDLSDPPKWVDGSGLSRYNKLTPRSIIQVLEKLRQALPEEELFQIFPAGGESGTIKNWYGGRERPFVFAKTGSLRHVHCLSGYVKTQRGKTLIFSFMHNNYTCPTKALKEEMEKVLNYIYLNY